MTLDDKREFADFVRALRRAKADIPLDQIIRLCAMADLAQRLAVQQCNRGLGPSAQKDDEANDRAAKALVSSWGPGFKLNFGDVRGYIYKVAMHTGDYNTMGGASEGWGVPTLKVTLAAAAKALDDGLEADGLTGMKEVIARNRETGHHFFDGGTMQFFRSKVETKLIRRRYFVTSEQFNDESPRLYTIRKANDDGSIEEVGEFQQYQTLTDAKRAIDAL